VNEFVTVIAFTLTAVVGLLVLWFGVEEGDPPALLGGLLLIAVVVVKIVLSSGYTVIHKDYLPKPAEAAVEAR